MQADHSKQCGKCGTHKPPEEFIANSHWCSKCRRAYLKNYYETHKEEIRNQQKGYVANNREAVAAAKKRYGDEHAAEQAERRSRWYAANRDKAITAAKQWVKDNSEKRKKYVKEYYQRNREMIGSQNRKHYEANKTRSAQVNRVWAKANPDAVRAIKVRNKANRKGAVGSFSKAEWVALKRRFNNRCVCCGRRYSKDDPTSKITVDHVVPLALGGTNYIGNLQPMCARCNSSKSAHNTADYRANAFTGIAQLALVG